MRHKRENDIVRNYVLLDVEEEERFREALRRNKKVKCISTIALGIENFVAVQGSPEALSRFEFDVF